MTAIKGLCDSLLVTRYSYETWTLSLSTGLANRNHPISLVLLKCFIQLHQHAHDPPIHDELNHELNHEYGQSSNKQQAYTKHDNFRMMFIMVIMVIDDNS